MADERSDGPEDLRREGKGRREWSKPVVETMLAGGAENASSRSIDSQANPS